MALISHSRFQQRRCRRRSIRYTLLSFTYTLNTFPYFFLAIGKNVFADYLTVFLYRVSTPSRRIYALL